ncbi:hypothetical protein WAE56_16045 [Iodobacter sp. LRB]|uniref:hypothetical protein n=1 Tax=unclassified Iodobacter TaxID=235634 RepID=UPI0026C9D2F0
MNPNEFTGLQLLQAMADGKLPAPSITQTMPMSMVHISEGLVRFTAQADERHLNPMGGCTAVLPPPCLIQSPPALYTACWRQGPATPQSI